MDQGQQLSISIALQKADQAQRDLEKFRNKFKAQFDQMEKRVQAAGAGMNDSMSKATKRMEANLSSSASRMNGIMMNAFKGLGAGIVGALSVAGLEQIVSRIADTAKGIATIGDEAKRAGLSSRSFQELGFVARQNRIEIDSLVDGIKELNLRADEWITTGGGSAAEAFQRLGYSAADLKTKLADPADLLADIIQRVQNLDRAAQIRIFDEIFGGTGGERFVQLIDQGADGIRRTVQQARDLGIVLDDDVIKKADEIDRKFNALADTVSTKLRSAVVNVVTEMTEMSRALNGTKEQAVALAGNRLMSTYKAIEDTKGKLDDLYLDKAAFPDDVTIDLNIERAKEDLELLKKQAVEIRDIMDRYQGYPGEEIKDTGDKSDETKPKVEGLNNALTNSSTAALNGAKGLKSYSDAIRALRNEVPALAQDLADLDARTRIDQAYRAALVKSRTTGEAMLAGQLRNEALSELGMQSAASNPTKYLTPFLAAGKTPASLTGLESRFSENLAKMFAAAPADVRASTSIYSGYRSVERQAQLWAEALQKYGSPEAARKWVAPPGNSQHNAGFAADLRFGDDAARQWFHANASQFGLSFPLDNEAWHIEDASARQKINTEEHQRRAQAITDQGKAYQDIINGSQEFVSSQRTEAQALNMGEQAAATYRREQQMLADAQKAGITLTDEQRRQIAALAQGMTQAELKTKELATSQQGAAEVSRFFGEQAVDGLTGLITGTMTAADAMKNLAAAMVRAALQAAILGEGPFAKLFAGGATAPSPTGGGKKLAGGGLLKLFGFADGGYVRGPGTGNSDSIPAWLSNGEFVVNAKATKQHLSTLMAINNGKVPGFAEGGFVGTAPRIPRANIGGNQSNSQSVTINAPVTVNAAGGTPEQNADLAKRVARETENSMRGLIRDEMFRQMKPGNLLNR
jgi:hypothetical protein